MSSSHLKNAKKFNKKLNQKTDEEKILRIAKQSMKENKKVLEKLK